MSLSDTEIGTYQLTAAAGAATATSSDGPTVELRGNVLTVGGESIPVAIVAGLVAALAGAPDEVRPDPWGCGSCVLDRGGVCDPYLTGKMDDWLGSGRDGPCPQRES